MVQCPRLDLLLKSFEKGLKPIVVINKIDRPDARAHWVLDQVFDLFDRLGVTDEQLDFPVIYTSAIEGISGFETDQMERQCILYLI